MSTHALRSPSGAHRWIACPGSVALEAKYPNTSSKYAAEGTAAHELASMALSAGTDARAYLGRVIEADGHDFEVDDDMAEHVQTYLDRVRLYTGSDGCLLIEQRLPIGQITNEEGATGTGDAVILLGDELQVHDLKFGRGVEVYAAENEQLMMYALGALYQYEALGPFTRIRLCIHQPRRDHFDEWDCTVADLRAFEQRAKDSLGGTTLNPGDKQCRFCKAKAECPALVGHISALVFDDLDALTGEATEPAPLTECKPNLLSTFMSKLDLIDAWCMAVRAAVEVKLFAGEAVPGYKLVEGKRGNRKWSDEEEVAKALKSMRLKHEQMYEYSLISPPKAEKLLKETPKRWEKVQALITQADGKPSVAPESDRRPTLVVKPLDFEDLT